MMPAQIVTATVAVGADTRTQPHYLGDQSLPCQIRKIIIHRHHQRSGASQVRRIQTGIGGFVQFDWS
jgi:hypothetical protein